MNGFPSLLAVGFAVGCTGIASAQDLILESQHEYFDAQTATRDSACQAAALNALNQRFEGIKSLTITNSNHWNSVVADVENYAFPSSLLSSEHGDVTAEILCLVSTQEEEIIEISFQFNPMLSGGRNASPYAAGSSMLVWQTTVKITGDS